MIIVRHAIVRRKITGRWLGPERQIIAVLEADPAAQIGAVFGLRGLTGDDGLPGPGVPAGGTTGQVLSKTSDTDFATLWSTPGGAVWGAISGTLSAQTDLQNALDGKQAAGSYAAAAHGHVIADVSGLQAALNAKETAGAAAAAVAAHEALSNPHPNYLTAAEAAAAFSTLGHGHAQADVTGLVAALAAKEPSITAGTTAQYIRGDKSLGTLDKTAAGLANVDNTSDAGKPVSTAQQTALNLKLNASAVSAFGLTLVDDADAATARGTLGLGSLATQSGTFSGASSGTNTGDQTITLTGNVTGSGTGSFATTIAAGVVTNAMLANVATATFKGRTTAGSGAPEDLTATQATALLNSFTSALKGLVPASGGGTVNYLRADGTWTAPAAAAAWGSVIGTLSAQTDLQAALDGKQASGSYAAASHTHAQADVTGLVAALAAKLNASAVSAFGLALVDDADATTARGTLGLGSLATQSGTFSGASSGTNSGDQTITLTGNVTGTGTGSFATTIAAGVVTNAMLANVATATFKGRTTAGTGAPEDLTATQATALLNAFTSALKGLVPASGGGTVNYLRADGTWAAPSGGGASVDPLDLTATGVAAPAAGTVRIFRKDHANRQMPAFIGPSGMDATLQPFFATNKIARWNPSGNVTTVPIIDGFTAALTPIGTATARNVAATNFITRLRRFGYVSAATAAAICGHYGTVAQWTIGDGAGLGGFHYVCRFVPADAAAVSGARMFVGLRNAVSAPANVEPSTLTNCIGLAQLSGSTNLQLVYGGSAAQTPIDLGAGFPASGASTAAYELELFASSANQTIGYKVTRLDNGTVASGTLSGTVGTQVPAATTFLAHAAWRTNNATPLACGLDIVQVYLETDN